LPPADFISEEGLPAGYSVAVLSEIGKILKVNISTVSVSAGARTAALVSGRADVVFWYEVNKQSKLQPDVPNDVILSEPYLEWDKFFHLSSAE
ncbi:MAG: transporter substrate-binding domain-containing protein, partial [Synergistaceae bacterium]|nr:transporter substrate-binding domain-containing protein [Synergistaceae bacterium]